MKEDPQIRNLRKDLKHLSTGSIPQVETAWSSMEYASALAQGGTLSHAEVCILHQWLHLSGKSSFLQALEPEQRMRWADLAFRIIQKTDFNIHRMFHAQLTEKPQSVLFVDMSKPEPGYWTYEQINRYTQEIASLFYLSVSEEPRVAVWSENAIDSACCDLACLFYDILDTPLNVHFQPSVVKDILKRLQINIVVTDTENRCRALEEIRETLGSPIQIFVLDPEIRIRSRDVQFLGEACKKLSPVTARKALENRQRKSLNRIVTVMFTSGSTGLPKGVCFTGYHLVSKRFARAAVLPAVGRDEVMLCYLPLFHTFGRYLEMLGTIYWGGTYVLSGNPSAETLLALFPKVNPTGFISVPLRWIQLQEECYRRMDAIAGMDMKLQAFQQIVGNKLRWGLSAAGYLDPKTFHFFQRNGVELCSGFGMTEATGGVTMTPPGQYVDDTVGIPLPGIQTRFDSRGELFISGHYIGRYLDEISLEDPIPYPVDKDSNYWLPTGDIFMVTREGYYQIVDRVKDIYKNNKGQTIAPRRVEQKFEGVHGIRRVFLVGDGKPYNVLFIVPELSEPVFQALSSDESKREYFHQLIRSANQDLAPYERVINFCLLPRDFDPEKKEITPKGSLNRKVIERHFADPIAELYQREIIELKWQDERIRLPRWFFRDLGILEDDIHVQDNGLYNRSTCKVLPLESGSEPDTLIIGDLEYSFKEHVIDMDLFSRQPLLWLGNPSLIDFCPCKDGWDVPLRSISPQVLLPWNRRQLDPENIPFPGQVKSRHLLLFNQLLSCMLFSETERAEESLKRLCEVLKQETGQLRLTIRYRLEALARHPVENMRCLAYQILLLDEPTPDYGKSFPAFVYSGLTFLNQASIETIAFSRLERRRLEALRQRLFMYRIQLKWPISETTRQQFITIFEILRQFVSNHPEFYASVRAELASWILHKADPVLAVAAVKAYSELVSEYEQKLDAETPPTSDADWSSRLLFDQGLSESEISRIKKVIVGTTFLKQSIMLAFRERMFRIEDVPDQGIWVSRIHTLHHHLHYLMSVTTNKGKHYKLQLVLWEDMNVPQSRESIYWLAAISGYPYGHSVLPRFGCNRPELGARSLAYLGELTLWDKIRQFSNLHAAGKPLQDVKEIRKLFIQAIAVFFQGWINSGRQIIPGEVSPGNVAIPEMDFQEGATILSITGWTPYGNTLSIVKPVLYNFYLRTIAHFPWTRNLLDIYWIFDACFEVLDEPSARQFLDQLKTDIFQEKPADRYSTDLAKKLDSYLENISSTGYMPLALHNAIDRYVEWQQLNPNATSITREQMVLEVLWLYRLHRFPDIIRYILYRNTYFIRRREKILRRFDRLIQCMSKNPSVPAVKMLELSELQSEIVHQEDREVFSRMVFPRMQTRQKLEFQTIGKSSEKHVIVQTFITDRYGEIYKLREPVEPMELGQLYRLFYEENFPKSISEQDEHFVLLDSQERIIGGMSYKRLENGIAQIEATVVASPVKERGIASAMLEDFCNRMASQGIEMVKTHFFLKEFYTRRGFRMDKRWGTLVKYLSPNENSTTGSSG